MTSQLRSPYSDEDRLAWLTLKLIPALGNRSILRLLRHFGSASAVLKAGAKELSAVPGLRERAREALSRKEMIRAPEEEWARLQREEVRLLCLQDCDYPANLSTIADPPAILFVRGRLEPRDLVAVAVVGSRTASATGMAFTERLCMDLAQYGVTIVSGFAMGIDTAAHRGALKAHGRTLAVLGCGLDINYPPSNARLRDEIPEAGAMLTEFPMATPPAPGHFPQRNRIISGLALGVVVVEAAHRSGSLITARLALEQGREVFAVPGMARHFQSVGPHRLLKEGAKLVECAEDVLEELRPLIRSSSRARTPGVICPRSAAVVEQASAVTEIAGLEPQEAQVLKILDHTPQHVDTICRSLQWPVSQVMAQLLALELKGMVRQLPGKHFMALDAKMR